MEDRIQDRATLNLHPDHLKDLKKSGLSNEIIRKAGIYSVPRSDFNKILGPESANKCESLLAFPYPERPEFARYKLFPPLEENGHKKKYHQPPGSGVPLYIPSNVKNKLGDHSIPLSFVEGEKKCLKLNQEGFLAIGTGGIWNWLKDGVPISDLDKIYCVNRKLTIVPDSDAWTNRNVLNAVYAFGIELQGRGGNVEVIVIPLGSQGEKNGADDFLVTYSSKKFEKLQRINLKHGAFKKSEDWHKAWTKEKEKPSKVIESNAIIVHPSYDVNHQKSFMSIGFRKTIILDNRPEERNFYLISEEGQFKLTEDKVFMLNGTKIIFDDENKTLSRIDERWSAERISNFICNPVSPNHIYLEIKKVLKGFLELQSEGEHGLLSAYIIATYFHRLFNAFPFLFFYGEKDSGKTRALEVCQRLCLNAIKIKGVSVASMADSIDGTRATFIMDQSESLSDPRNTELVGILADSYTPGGGKRRIVDTSNKGRRLLEFETYGPKIFASRKMIDEDLMDRCIHIPMLKTRKEFPYPESFLPLWGEFRDKLYRFALMNWKKIKDLYQDSGQGMTKRVRELWRPIETVFLAEDVPKEELDLVRIAFLKSMEETQFELSESDHEFFRVLLNLLALKDRGEWIVSVKEIVDNMDPKLLPTNWKGDHYSEKALHTWAGKRIGLFSLYNRQGREPHSGKRFYYFSYEHVKDVYSRWSDQIVIDQADLEDDLSKSKKG